jgi:hypothetical protein
MSSVEGSPAVPFAVTTGAAASGPELMQESLSMLRQFALRLREQPQLFDALCGGASGGEAVTLPTAITPDEVAEVATKAVAAAIPTLSMRVRQANCGNCRTLLCHCAPTNFEKCTPECDGCTESTAFHNVPGTAQTAADAVRRAKEAVARDGLQGVLNNLDSDAPSGLDYPPSHERYCTPPNNLTETRTVRVKSTPQASPTSGKPGDEMSLFEFFGNNPALLLDGDARFYTTLSKEDVEHLFKSFAEAQLLRGHPSCRAEPVGHARRTHRAARDHAAQRVGRLARRMGAELRDQDDHCAARHVQRLLRDVPASDAGRGCSERGGGVAAASARGRRQRRRAAHDVGGVARARV